ncbi:FAD synthetase family protein [Bacillus sp. AGMB 02131]|uniref:FAD synthase n=2 Tax=Peribacillus faecalis TaxID=2772559 RepID=A0A927CSM1_9BACI|nr:FAD synthetase family protein [Peribacillus faecalis]
MLISQAGSLKLSQCMLSIGSFDGVHLGHQSVIRQMVERSRVEGVPSVVYTFDPPPRVYFKSARQLTTIEEKADRIRRLGVEHLIVASFTANYLNSSVIDFIQEIKELNPSVVIVGSDFRFGKNRSGGLDDLRAHCKVQIVQSVCCKEGKVISSTRIRDLLSKGDFLKAYTLLNGAEI